MFRFLSALGCYGSIFLGFGRQPRLPKFERTSRRTMATPNGGRDTPEELIVATPRALDLFNIAHFKKCAWRVTNLIRPPAMTVMKAEGLFKATPRNIVRNIPWLMSAFGT